MDKVKNIFVFVVCGSDEHIRTLNFSLRYLKHFSKNEIIVVTDLSRNESKILHNNLVDIKTPTELDNHQASIYLKTSLHRVLLKENLYCYIDTDIIALVDAVDNVFEYFKEPIIFAEDHCTMRKFSPNAINCGCIEKHKVLINQLNKLFEKLDLDRKIKNEKLQKKGYQLNNELVELKKNKTKKLIEIVKYFSSGNKYKFKDDFIYNKKDKYWTDTSGNIIRYDQENVEKRIEKITGLIWNSEKNSWRTNEGNNIYNSECHHLREAIIDKFGVEISTSDYQHWNGGVFIFDKSSFEFMENWHNKTMGIFNDPYWKTRDQGTLIATVWEFGLQYHKVLPKVFNFIADYNNPDFKFDKETSEFTDPTGNIYKPFFVHVYHHFGEKGWDVWDYIESILPEN